MRISIYPSDSIVKWIRGKGTWQKLSGLEERGREEKWGGRVLAHRLPLRRMWKCEKHERLRDEHDRKKCVCDARPFHSGLY